jgi:hypothetical protein
MTLLRSRTILLFALVALVSVAGSLMAVGQCIECVTGYTTSPSDTASHWGKGSSCSAAQSDLDQKLLDAAEQFCGPTSIGSCQLQVQVTAPCWHNGTEYVVDGYADFGCYEGDMICQ